MARASRQKRVTVDEIVLVPGDDAIVAPEWVPYKERVQPGDLSPGDLLPVDEDDPRLVPTYSFGDDPLDADDKAQVRQVAQRPRPRPGAHAVAWRGATSPPSAGTTATAARHAPLAQSAPDVCSTCGFLVRLAGPLSDAFGVCANGNANDDGRVVSLDHGCGAHSEVQLRQEARAAAAARRTSSTRWATTSSRCSDGRQSAADRIHTA